MTGPRRRLPPAIHSAFEVSKKLGHWLRGITVPANKHPVPRELRDADQWLLDDLGVEIVDGSLHMRPAARQVSNCADRAGRAVRKAR